MAGRRTRKRHDQLRLLTKDGTGVLPKCVANKRRHRGGRPPKGARAGSPHKRRPDLKRGVPVHVALRVEPAVGNLRRRDIYRALRRASIVVARHRDVRIVHVSLQRTHVHLLVEADDKFALAKGMKSFQISAAKHINRAMTPAGQPRRRGRVFMDRYHVELITCPTQAHRALSYVLNNWRKHGEDRSDAARGWLVDPFSTGILFESWKEQSRIKKWHPDYEPLVVKPPTSWLLRRGWQALGLISCLDVPSARPT